MTNLSVFEWIQSDSYLDQCKQQGVSFRKYPQWDLGIAKRKYLSPYDKQHAWVNACRGLVLNYKTNELLMIPPMKSRDVLTQKKFLKRVSSSEELIDGVMINLFYYQDQWFVSTRSTITPLKDVPNLSVPWATYFVDCSPLLPVSELKPNHTYSFVMRHTQNRLTSPIETNELVLVEVYKEGTRLETLPKLTGIRCPLSTRDCIGVQKGLTGCKDGVRYKWLTSEHKFIQMIRSNDQDPLLEYLKLRNSGYLTPFLQLFPEKQYEYSMYRKQVSQLIQLIYQYYVAVNIHKQIESSDVPFALKPVMHQLHNHYLTTKQGISVNYVKQYIYELDPIKIYFILKHRNG